MKKLSILIPLIILSLPQLCQAKSRYDRALKLDGLDLRLELKTVVRSNHKTRSYSELYNHYFKSDLDTTYDKDYTILDVYSENPKGKDPYNFSTRNDRCGQYRKESDCFNREHLFPQGTFSKALPMRSDIHHVFPTDGKVNGIRSSYPFGEVKKAKKITKNGSQLGSSKSPGYTGTVFEPIDEFKGNIARAMLYFAIRYEDIANRSSRWKGHAMTCGRCKGFYKKWFIDVLKKWHKQDPVDEFERKRNDSAEDFQGNRNPFIDHPEFVEKIW